MSAKSARSMAKQSASVWAARRDAVVKIRAAASSQVGTAKLDALEAQKRALKLSRITSSAAPVRRMPDAPPRVYGGPGCGCTPRYERPSQVHPNVFVGDMDDAREAVTLRSLGITHIVNMARTVPCYHPDEFVYTHIAIDDAPSEDIRSRLAEAFRAMDEASSAGRGVLVHCVAGVSRSVTAVIAWLVERKGWSLRQATATVRRWRPILDPNPGFRLALAEHEVAVRGFSSVASGKDSFWDFHPWSERRLRVRHAPEPPPPPLGQRAARLCGECLAPFCCLGLPPDD